MRLAMNVNDRIDRKKCTGCGACIQKCPFNAIETVEDEYGFKYPKVNMYCTDCSACIQVCSVINMCRNKFSYVAVNNNKQERNRSSSGGVFSALAHCVLDYGGVVYGATIERNLLVKHIRVNTIRDIAKIQGSKYIQSDTEKTYLEVEQDLSRGYVVLYSGTPCQIAGLKNYLGDENSNLYTVDLICHGVSGKNILKKSIDNHFCRDNNQEYQVYSFRAKSWNHVTSFGLSIIKDNKTHRIANQEDLWYTSYIKEISLRRSCYDCQYAQEKRTGDITLGDCRTSPLYFTFHPGEALSTVLINSNQGAELWKLAREYIDFKELDYAKEKKSNLPLHECSRKEYERTVFLKDWSEKNWDYLFDKYSVQNEQRKGRIKEVLPKQFKSVIKGMLYKWYAK